MQRIRHIDSTEASHHLVLVPLAHVFQRCREWFLHSRRQHCAPILMALPFPEQHLTAGYIDVLHSESQARRQAQAIYETWRTLGTAHIRQPSDMLAEDVAV